MRHILLTLTLPCLFACSQAEEGSQKASIPTTATVSGVSVKADASSNSSGTLHGAIGQAVADEIESGLQQAFDEQARIYAQGGTKEEIANARALYVATKTLEESEFVASFRVAETTDGRSGLQILQSMADAEGLILDLDGFRDALSKTPSFEVQGLSKIEALERIAAEAGLVPTYPEGFLMGDTERTLGFTKKPRTTPTCFAGPFLVQVLELDEQPPHSVGTVHLTARALGMPAAARTANDNMFETFYIEQVQSNRGQDLRAHPDMRRMSTPQCAGSMVTIHTEVDLKGLLSGTEQIESLAGTLHLTRPSQVTPIAFTSLSPGLRKVGRFNVLLKEVGTSTSIKVSTEEDSDLAVIWAPDSPHGDPLGIVSNNCYSYNNTTDATLTTPETPNQLSAKLIESTLLDFPFELHGIEFLRASEQPEAIAALEFDAAQPVSVVFVEFKSRDESFQEVLLRTVNHANKDVRTLDIKMIYLDDKNKEIKNSFTSINPPFDFEADIAKPFVVAGGIETTTQTAFFMPPETVSVQISLREVEFMDGTTWKADE